MPELNTNRRSLAVVGALHVDEVATVEGSFVHAASNPVSWQRYVGGVAANVARAAQCLYAHSANERVVSFHTALGTDPAGTALANCMQAQGLELIVHPVDSQDTGRYSVVLDSSGELLLGLADVTIAERLNAHDVLQHIDPATTALLFLDTNLAIICIDQLVVSASEQQIFLAACCVSPAKAVKLLPHAHRIDLLFCNRREALALAVEAGTLCTGIDVDTPSLAELAGLLLAMGFRSFVLTDAANPVVICEQRMLRTVNVPPVSLTHNVNGAGDALAGATLAAMTKGSSLYRAVEEFGLSLANDVLTGRHLPLPLQATPKTHESV